MYKFSKDFFLFPNLNHQLYNNPFSLQQTFLLVLFKQNDYDNDDENETRRDDKLNQFFS